MTMRTSSRLTDAELGGRPPRSRLDGRSVATVAAVVLMMATLAFAAMVYAPSSAGVLPTGPMPVGAGAAHAGIAPLAKTPPILTLSPAKGTVGTIVNAQLKGMLPSTTVTIKWNTTTTLCSGSTGPFGQFGCNLTVPAYFAASVSLTGSDGADVPTAAFQVVPNLAISPSSGPVQTFVTATGTGFASSSTVTITFGGTTPVCSMKSNTNGGFVCTFATIGTPTRFPTQFVNVTDSASTPNTASQPFAVTFSNSGLGTFYGTDRLPLPAASTRTCSVPLVGGLCQATGVGGAKVAPYLNVSNDMALNYTSTGVLALAYTSYSGGNAPCANARPYSQSNIAVETSPDGGSTWTTVSYLGTNAASSTCAAPMLYPSAYEPALTSLSDGTIVLAYVQYNATSPAFPPFYATNGSAIPSYSQLVLTESHDGGLTWGTPMVLNASNSNPSATVQFQPVRPSIAAFGSTIYVAWMSIWAVGKAPVLPHAAFAVSPNAGASWGPTTPLGATTVGSANPDLLVVPSTVGATKAGTLFVAYDTNVLVNATTGIPSTASVVLASSTANGSSFTTTTVSTLVAVNLTIGSFFNPAPMLAWTSTGRLDLAYVAGTPGVAGMKGNVTTLFFFTSSNPAASPSSGWTASTSAGRLFLAPNTLYPGAPNASRILSIAMTPMALTTAGTVSIEATIYNASACTSAGCGAMTEMASQTATNGVTWSPPAVVSGAIEPNGTVGSYRTFLVGEYETVLAFPGHVLYAYPSASCPSFDAYPSSRLAQCGIFGFAGVNQTTLWGTTTVALSSAWTGATTTQTFVPTGLPSDASWSLTIGGSQFVASGLNSITVANLPAGVPVAYNISGLGQYNSTYQYRWWKSSPLSPASFSSDGSVSTSFAAWVPLTVQVAPSLLAGPNCAPSAGCAPSYFPPPWYFNINLGGFPGADMSGCPTISTTTSYSGTCTAGCVYTVYDYDRYNAYIKAQGSTTTYTYRGAEWYGVGCADTWVSHNATPAGPGSIVKFNTPIWVQTGLPFNLNVTHWNPLASLCGQNKPVPTNQTMYPGTTNFELIDECYSVDVAFLQLLAWFGFGSGGITSQSTNISLTPTGPVTEIADFKILSHCYGNYIEWVWEIPTYTYFQNTTTCAPWTQGTGGTGGVGSPVNFTETGLPAGTSWGITLTSPNDNQSKTATASSMTFPSVGLSTPYSVIVDTIPGPQPGSYWVGTTVSTVTAPSFTPVVVAYTLSSGLGGSTFRATTTETGLPAGSSYAFQVSTSAGPTTYPTAAGWTSPPVTSFELVGGTTFSLNGSAVYEANGTAYYVHAINVSFASINSTPGEHAPGSSLAMVGYVTLTLEYAVMFRVTVESTSGGSVTPASQWVAGGQAVSLTAKSDNLHTFTGWTGYGPGARTTHGPTPASITVVITGPVSEVANFRPLPQATFSVVVNAVGLPAGVPYTVTLNSVTYSGNGTFTIANLTTGNYTLSAGTSYSSPVPDARYSPATQGIQSSFPAGPSGTVYVGQNGSVTVTYAVQYLLTVSTTPGGSVTGAENGPWFEAGSQVTLTAVPTPGPPGVGSYFVGWNGNGSASRTSTAPSIALTMTSPVEELAEFLMKPVSPPRTFLLTVSETGLPTGVQWNASVGSLGNSTTETSMVIAGLNGTYTLSLPIVPGAFGVRYAPTPSNATAVLAGVNATVTVTFATEYLVTVRVAGNGTVSPASQWVASGHALALSATPNSSWQFESWKGTQTGTSPAVSVTVNGPMTEVAQFTPVPAKAKATNALAGAPIAIGLLVGLLLVGLLVTYVINRRRGGAVAAAESEPPAPAMDDGMAAESGEPAEEAGPAPEESTEASEP